MIHDRRPPEEAADWLRYADEDLALARGIIDQRMWPLRQALLNAQQAAEKTLKAFLIAKGHAYPRTHNIAHLVELCSAVDQGLGTVARASADLTPFAGPMRYPGDEREPSLSQALAWIDAADDLLSAVKQRIGVA